MNHDLRKRFTAAAASLQSAFDNLAELDTITARLDELFPDETGKREQLLSLLSVQFMTAERKLQRLRGEVGDLETALSRDYTEINQRHRAAARPASAARGSAGPRSALALFNIIERLPDGYTFPAAAKTSKGDRKAVFRRFPDYTRIDVGGMGGHTPRQYLIMDWNHKPIDPMERVLLDGGSNFSWNNIQEVLQSVNPSAALDTHAAEAGDRLMQAAQDRIDRSPGIFADEDLVFDVSRLAWALPGGDRSKGGAALREIEKISKQADSPTETKQKILAVVERWRGLPRRRASTQRAAPPSPRGLSVVEDDLARIEQEVGSLSSTPPLSRPQPQVAPQSTFDRKFLAFVSKPRTRREYLDFFKYNDPKGAYTWETDDEAEGISTMPAGEILEMFGEIFEDSNDEHGTTAPRLISPAPTAKPKTGPRRELANLPEPIGYRASTAVLANIKHRDAESAEEVRLSHHRPQDNDADKASWWFRYFTADHSPGDEPMWGRIDADADRPGLKIQSTLSANYSSDFWPMAYQIIKPAPAQMAPPEGVGVSSDGSWDWSREEAPPVVVGLPVTVSAGNSKRGGTITWINKNRSRVVIEVPGNQGLSGKYSWRKKAEGYWKVGKQARWSNAVDLGVAIEHTALD